MLLTLLHLNLGTVIKHAAVINTIIFTMLVLVSIKLVLGKYIQTFKRVWTNENQCHYLLNYLSRAALVNIKKHNNASNNMLYEAMRAQ